jgi:ADP-ribose pyrophosphatase
MRIVIKAELQKWEQPGATRFLAKQHGLSLSELTFVHPVTRKEELYTQFIKKEGFTVVPVTTDGHLVLVRQFKQASRDFFLEFPCGVMKPDEAGTEAAMRELLEETGYTTVRTLETSSGMIHLAPRKSPSGYRTFVALGCRFTGKQALDEGEDAIEVYEATVDEVRDLIIKRDIRSCESRDAFFMARELGHFNR